jgi:hypothetical protein
LLFKKERLFILDRAVAFSHEYLIDLVINQFSNHKRIFMTQKSAGALRCMYDDVLFGYSHYGVIVMMQKA